MRPCSCGPCPYLPELEETLCAVRFPGIPNSLHASLIELGYRHSGDIIYTTACEKCAKCLAMRVDPLRFRPSKKQRHIMNKNADIELELSVPVLTDEKFDIYQRYLRYQHSESATEMTFEGLKKSTYFVLPSSVEIQYRLKNRIVGITIADIIPFRALSSVYHFFDPEFAKRSIGTFSMMAEIGLCRCFEIPYFYPGLWIQGCKKMEYKTNFKPYQLRIHGEWVEFDKCVDEAAL